MTRPPLYSPANEVPAGCRQSILICPIVPISFDRHNGGVTETPDTKQAALDQLRGWRVWFDRRDPLIYAAHLAGASLSEIHDASGVAVNTARSAIAAQEAAVQTTATDPLAPYHHPNFLSVNRPSETRFEFAFKPFTGREPKPEIPDVPYRRRFAADDGAELEAGLSHDELIPLYQEYDAARKLWATARFRGKLPSLVAQVGPVWSAYQQARAAMNEAYDALLTTGDGTWRAQVMRLTGLQADARVAAAAWDAAEEKLLKADHAFRVEAGFENDDWNAPELEDLVSELGTDAKAWKFNALGDHQAEPYSLRDFVGPAAKDTAAVIEQQRNRIREVADLTGEPSA